jgi:hypothetical protein
MTHIPAHNCGWAQKMAISEYTIATMKGPSQYRKEMMQVKLNLDRSTFNGTPNFYLRLRLPPPCRTTVAICSTAFFRNFFEYCLPSNGT